MVPARLGNPVDRLLPVARLLHPRQGDAALPLQLFERVVDGARKHAAPPLRVRPAQLLLEVVARHGPPVQQSQHQKFCHSVSSSVYIQH